MPEAVTERESHGFGRFRMQGAADAASVILVGSVPLRSRDPALACRANATPPHKFRSPSRRHDHCGQTPRTERRLFERAPEGFGVPADGPQALATRILRHVIEVVAKRGTKPRGHLVLPEFVAGGSLKAQGRTKKYDEADGFRKETAGP